MVHKSFHEHWDTIPSVHIDLDGFQENITFTCTCDLDLDFFYSRFYSNLMRLTFAFKFVVRCGSQTRQMILSEQIDIDDFHWNMTLTFDLDFVFFHSRSYSILVYPLHFSLFSVDILLNFVDDLLSAIPSLTVSCWIYVRAWQSGLNTVNSFMFCNPYCSVFKSSFM